MAFRYNQQKGRASLLTYPEGIPTRLRIKFTRLKVKGQGQTMDYLIWRVGVLPEMEIILPVRF